MYLRIVTVLTLRTFASNWFHNLTLIILIDINFLYECISPKEYKKQFLNYKGPLAYFTDIWLSENNVHQEK